MLQLATDKEVPHNVFRDKMNNTAIVQKHRAGTELAVKDNSELER